ncbi:MAG: MmcQ/YjbR family DNA-binding protein [Fimbriimonadaceae bacterium]|nr:MmcQ/YjbR family DNA-binding protein [Fimbriimonadaceae bacterium]
MNPQAVYQSVRAHCLAKPNAVEEYPWGHVVWKVKKKIFAIGSENEARFTVKSTPDRQSQLILHPNIVVASHVGRFGWVSILVDSEEMLELALEIIDEAYDSIVVKKSTLRS